MTWPPLPAESTEFFFERVSVHKIDVLAAGTTHTMQRQVYESYTKTGFSFSVPYVYEGLQLAGK